MKYLLTNQETERLSFRLVTMADFDTWLPFFNRKEIYKYLWLDETKTEKELCEFWFKKCLTRYTENRGGLNAVILKSTGKMIGKCGLLVQDVENEKRLEIGYSFLPEYWHKGYATEAAICAKDFGFENEFDKDFNSNIISMVHVENTGSAKVARYNSMTFEKQVPGLGNHVFDIFSITSKEWEATQNK
ncbi:GNAT family N-acetyltransferase [Nonlabens sp.]|uniref:GNAT family N-acetyltransferase n=1 Tax=Nonlabens sp. TaxID=1888209 RepID=UPI0039E5A102